MTRHDSINCVPIRESNKSKLVIMCVVTSALTLSEDEEEVRRKQQEDYL